MPIRDRAEEALTRALIDHEYPGMVLSFQFGEPVLRRSDGVRLKDSVYYDARELATKLYEKLITTVDWNRLSIEVMSAYWGLNGNEGPEFGDDPSTAGRALKAAWSNQDRFNDYKPGSVQ